MALQAQYISNDIARRMLEEEEYLTSPSPEVSLSPATMQRLEEEGLSPAQRASRAAMESVYGDYMRYGHTRPELREMLREGVGPSGTPSTAREFLAGHMETLYGPMPEADPGERARYSPLQWRYMQEHRRTRGREEITWDPSMGPMPRAGQWEQAQEALGVEGPLWTRQGSKSFYPADIFERSGFWLTGKEGGVTLPWDPSKTAKRGQLTGARETIDVYQWGAGGLRETSQFAALRGGEADVLPERGTALQAAIPLASVTEAGMSMLGRGAIQRVAQRRTERIDLPEGFDPQDIPAVGTTWRAGEEMRMFQGAAPLGMLRRGAWEEARLMDAQRTEGGMQAVFERSMAPEAASLYAKTGGMKTTLPVGDVAALTGRQDIEAVLQYKDPLGVAWQHMMARDPQQLQTQLAGVGWTGGMPSTWKEAGPEFIEAFRRSLPIEDVTYRRKVHPEAAEGYRQLAEQYGGTLAPEAGGMLQFQATIPSLVGPTFAPLGIQPPTHKPRLTSRELERLERQEDPRMYERVMEESAGVRQDYQAIINAAAASTGQFEAPAGAITPSAEQLQTLAAEAQGRAMEAVGAKDIGDVPPDILRRQAIESARGMFGAQPLQVGEGQYLAAPERMHRFLASGAMEAGEATGYGWHYGSALLGMATGKGREEAIQKALGAQEELGFGREMQRRGTSAYLQRAMGGVIAGSPVLGGAEYMRPVEDIQRLYGLKPGTEEAARFSKQWAAGSRLPVEEAQRRGLPTPGEMISAYPTPGDEPFQMGMRAIHPEAFKERGGLLSERTPFVLSRGMTQMLHKDFDADIAQGMALGHLEAQGESFQVAGIELPWATSKDVAQLGQRAVQWGAGELAGEIGEGPGGVAGLREALDVSKWGTYSPEEIQGQMSAHLQMQQMIGPAYNWAEKIQRAAAPGEQLSAAQALFNQTYQVMQRPKALPKELEELRGLSSGYNPVTGGYAAGGVPRGGPMQGGGGMAGLQRFMLTAMTQLTTGGSPGGGAAFTPEQAAALTAPPGTTEAMAGIYGQYAAGEIGLAKALPGLVGAMGRPETMMQTPMGAVSAGLAYQKAIRVGKAKPDDPRYAAWLEGLDPGLREQLEAVSGKMGAYSTAMSKRAPADETPAERQARGTERLRAAHAAGMGEGFVKPIATAAQGADVEQLLGTLAFPTGPAPAPPPRGSLIERTQRRGPRTPEQAQADLPAGDDFEETYGMTRAEAGVAQPTGYEFVSDPSVGGGGYYQRAAAGGGAVGGGGGRPGVAAPAAAQPGTGKDPQSVMFSRIFGVSAQEFRTAVDAFNKNLGRWTEEVAPAIESTQDLTKSQVRQTKTMLQWERTIQRGLRQARLPEDQGGWPTSMAPTVATATALVAEGPEGALLPGVRALGQGQAALAQARYEGTGGGGRQLPPWAGGLMGVEGPFRGAEKIFGKAFSGWELMRLKRIWSMTGGAAMGQIPIAAQEEQAATRAAMVGVPMGQAQMGGMGQQLLTYQAGQQAFKGQVGRAAYGAWGWTQQGITGRGLATAAGIGGPALGAGLVTGAVASMIPGVAATAVGLPIAAAAGIYGGARYAQEAQADPERMALAMAQGPEEGGWDYRLAMAGAGVRPERGGWGQPVYPQAQAPPSQVAYGQRMMTGELAGLTGAGRQTAVQAATEQYAPEWMAPTAAMGAGTEWMSYFGGTNLQQIYQDPRFSAMAMRGLRPQQFAQTAAQWGMGPGRGEEIMTQQLGATEAGARQAEYVAGQWQGLTAFGMEPMEVRGMAYERGAPQRVEGGWQVPEARLQPLGGLGQRAFGQWQQAAWQEQMLGLDVPEAPRVGPEAPSMAEQWQAQMPRSQARRGLQTQLMGMGVGGLGIAQGLGGDLEGMGMLRRFMGGDQGMMNLVGMQNVGMGAQMGGVSYDLAPITESFTTMMEALGQVDPQAASAMSDMFQSLQPLMEQSGLKMGTTQMWSGFMGGAQMPRGVDAGLAAQYGGMVETGGLRALQREQTSRQYEQQDWQFAQQEENLQWRQTQQFGGTFQGFQTRGTFEIQDEMRNLGRMWEEWMQDWREQQRQVQYGQFMENWQVQAQRQPVQFQWQREDLAFRGAQSTLQYAWGQEDVQERMRYATGRERRQLMKQQERSTITYAMGMGRLETEGGRIDQREQWAKEDLERQKRHFLERFRLQDEYQSKYRSYYERRKALEDELQEIRKFNAQFSLTQDAEALARAIEMAEHTRAIHTAQVAVNTALDDAVAKQTVFATNLINAMVRANTLAKNMLTALDAANRAVADARSSYNAYRHGGGGTQEY